MGLILMTRQEQLNASLLLWLLKAGRQGGMMKWRDERWKEARAGRRQPPSPHLTPLPTSPPLHPGLGALTSLSIIHTHWLLLIAIAVHYLYFAEITPKVIHRERERCRSDKWSMSPTRKRCTPFQKQQLWNLTVPINKAGTTREQNSATLYY